MTNEKYQPTWDLDVIFSGGSGSEAFKTYLQDIEEDINSLSEQVNKFHPSQEQTLEADMIKLVMIMDPLMKRMRDAFAYVSCLSAQDVNDKEASLLLTKRSDIRAKMDAVQTVWKQKLSEIDNERWVELLETPPLNDISFYLNESRLEAKERLSVSQEVLLNDLAVDGYHAWNHMYQSIVGKMTIPIEVEGKISDLSVGQASNLLSNPNRSIRHKAFRALQHEWEKNSDLIGHTLNHLAGFRLQVYKHRQWDDVLKEPLMINRMKKATLDAMWTAITNKKQSFVSYFEKKASLLGLKRLSFYDLGAPLAQTNQTYTYTEGAEFIINHFRSFSPEMAEFAKKAFEKRWIEAEDRAGKRPGGFCTSFPASKQTRIFMTYSGTLSNVATLAHELGHAYHQHVMNDLPAMNQRYAMNVAETASTLAEMIVADAAVKNAKTKEEKLFLLEDKLQRTVAFFMNIHARFIFEERFYEERKQGMVPVSRLNELMVEAQKEAYCEALEEYDPTFWASKLHFHITGTPFYNFPYTFGYLFSLGIYAHAIKQGNSFEMNYIQLLRDTGRMEVEDLATKHLQVDLTKPEFWENGIDLCLNDLEQFLAIN
ncbi:MAG TPA: M3 family oligoendopeptidase [Cerasibacillus sp.]|uniref:M3 family oligoendopeptidase n=1 Tax=Cerasibacillus sp. TaxID=2498711 RepID=UPI002F42922A